MKIATGPKRGISQMPEKTMLVAITTAERLVAYSKFISSASAVGSQSLPKGSIQLVSYSNVGTALTNANQCMVRIAHVRALAVQKDLGTHEGRGLCESTSQGGGST